MLKSMLKKLLRKSEPIRKINGWPSLPKTSNANSTLTKELGAKKELYAAVGILEYWVIDLQNQELFVFRDLQGTVYRSEIRYQSGTITPLAFDDLSLDIAIILN
jgi:Uma2 family endonuclease